MITGVEERSVNTESAAIRGITGAADSHATFGPVINRIENLLNGLEKPDDYSWMDRLRARGEDWLAKVAALEEPEIAPLSIRPSVAPPVACRPERLAVTDIKHLIRDPYAIYAKRILNLKRLDSLTKSPDAPLRGTLIHDL